MRLYGGIRSSQPAMARAAAVLLVAMLAACAQGVRARPCIGRPDFVRHTPLPRGPVMRGCWHLHFKPCRIGPRAEARKLARRRGDASARLIADQLPPKKKRFSPPPPLGAHRPAAPGAAAVPVKLHAAQVHSSSGAARSGSREAGSGRSGATAAAGAVAGAAQAAAAAAAAATAAAAAAAAAAPRDQHAPWRGR
ncbi:MAG: hypothetical protein J3K34DRAFT_436529, partial [Monoraphidium minutum]